MKNVLEQLDQLTENFNPQNDKESLIVFARIGETFLFYANGRRYALLKTLIEGMMNNADFKTILEQALVLHADLNKHLQSKETPTKS